MTHTTYTYTVLLSLQNRNNELFRTIDNNFEILGL